ncbi:RING-type domain-containing protein [Fusarium sp. LHS14.1]|nr:RING-type domain-containing protein [Fusarium sp. LHS14.1]
MQCNEMFCGKCWDKQKEHQTPEPDHEQQTVPNDATIVYSTLKIRSDERHPLRDVIARYQAPKLRQIGDNGEWFSVRPKNEAGDYSLVEGPAYDLLADSFKITTAAICPALVSFVGTTGSGKSALISLLSKFYSHFSTNHFKTPDVGESESRQPTSSNVHLYADPQTYRNDNPILYAECEGIDEDETYAEMKNPLAGGSSSSPTLPHTSRIPQLRSQNIIWSKMPRNAGAWTRKEITRILFPRILYIFSDVVVFSFSRIRHNDTILQLVEWGHSAMMHSYNKPILPTAIIAFINRDDRLGPWKYDLGTARTSFFEMPSLQRISENKELQPYIQYRKTNGKIINSAEELLDCYYSSVSVMHFPNGNHPTTMHQQIQELYGIINALSLKKKTTLDWKRWNWNAATFPLFIRKAFAHFASKYETPFNFSDAWVDVQNFSLGFDRAIFNLARMARGRRDMSDAGIGLWEDMSGFVASCLFLRYAREKMTDHRVPEMMSMRFEEITEQYWTKLWPCSYRIKIPEGYQQCVNGPCGHPHHQGGKAIKRGDHSASHSHEVLRKRFRFLVENAFLLKRARLSFFSDVHGRLEEEFATHLEETRNFYKRIGGTDKFVSHLPCLVCLDGVPEHSLPCGHVICRECANAIGDATAGGFVTLARCPIQNHREEDWPMGLAMS